MKHASLLFSTATLAAATLCYTACDTPPSEVKPAAATEVPDISRTTIVSSLVSADAKTTPHPTSLMTDGDRNTYYWSGCSPIAAQIIDFTFASPIPTGKTVKIYSGFGSTNAKNPQGDAIKDAVLEASPDSGDSWTPIATFHCGHAEAKTSFDSAHYRIRFTAKRRGWIAIQEFTITDNPLTQQTVSGSVTLNNQAIPLSVTTDLEGFADMEQSFADMATLYFEIWPKLVTWLGASPTEIPRDIDISFVKDMTNPAHAGGHTMTMNAKHLTNHPKDGEGVFTHELGHIVQQYRVYHPTWFVEGSADYLRYRQFPDRKWANSQRGGTDTSKPLAHYWNSACFLLWMEETYKKPIVPIVSRAIYDGSYQENIFKDLTGSTLKELAEIYKTSGYQPKVDSPKY